MADSRDAAQPALAIPMAETIELDRVLGDVCFAFEALDGRDLNTVAQYVIELCNLPEQSASTLEHWAEPELRTYLTRCVERLAETQPDMLEVVSNLLDAVARARAIRAYRRSRSGVRQAGSAAGSF